MRRRRFLGLVVAGCAGGAGCSALPSENGDEASTDGGEGDFETRIRLQNEHDRTWATQFVVVQEPFERVRVTRVDGSTETIEVSTLDELSFRVDIERTTAVEFEGASSRSRQLEAAPDETVEETVRSWEEGGVVALISEPDGRSGRRGFHYIPCHKVEGGVGSFSVEIFAIDGDIVLSSGGSCTS